MLKTLFSGGGPKGAHQTLIFHRVLAESDPLMPGEITQARFAELLALLKRRFSVVTLGDAWAALQNGTLPPASVSITFDDGYADNYAIARPLLLQHGLPATFFIASGFLDGGRMWNDTVWETLRRLPAGRHALPELAPLGLDAVAISDDASRKSAAEQIIPIIKFRPVAERQALVDQLASRVTDLPDDMMMSSDQVLGLQSDGMEIGGHTRTHPILEVLDDDLAYAEIRDGKRDLETLLGEDIGVFAYPNGRHGQDFSERHQQMVRELGFDLAVSTNYGVSTAASDAYRLPRFTPWRRIGKGFTLDLLRNRYGWL